MLLEEFIFTVPAVMGERVYLKEFVFLSRVHINFTIERGASEALSLCHIM